MGIGGRKRLRFFLNHNPALAGELSGIFSGEINRFLCQNTTGTPAQLHFIQRFGGALNLHIHVHAVVSDGVFNLKTNAIGRKEVVFTPVPCPTDQQLAAIVTAVRKKFIRRVRRACGLPREAAGNLLSWKNLGFSIHEEVLIKDSDREGLKRLRVLLEASPFAKTAGLRGKSQHGALPHRAEGGQIGNAGNDAHRVPAALDTADAAAQGYASAVSRAMLI
ncbi:MAG: transposase [Elusimicrobiota bacterium]|nr:transposase [Elusimicrobiota bacterium]